METIGSKRSYALIWCTPNNDDDDDDSAVASVVLADSKVQSTIDSGKQKRFMFISRFKHC